MKKAFDMTDVLDILNFDNVCSDFDDATSDEDEDAEEIKAVQPDSVTTLMDSDESDNESESEEGESYEFESCEEDTNDDPFPMEIEGHLGCLSHSLQLGINAALKSDESSKSFLNMINHIMVFFKKSVMWSDELKKITSTDVILPAKTRWNATLDILKRFQEVN